MGALGAGGRLSLFRAPLGRGPAVDVALRCLHDTERPFALVGAWAGGGALLGCSPVRVAGADEDPFKLLGDATVAPGSAPGVGGGWVGYLGYELHRRAEMVHPSPPRAGPMPLFVLAYYDHVVRCDAAGEWWFEALGSREREGQLNERQTWWADRLAAPPEQQSGHTSGWKLAPSPPGHAALAAACRDRIHAGDLFQANLCAEFTGCVEGSPLELFIRGVRTLAPDRAAFLQGPWGAIVSLSPELFLERHGRRVRTEPIKGTRRRPAAAAAAAAERAALVRSAKDRAENVMIVDLMRNDLGRVCDYGTVAVKALAQARAHTGVWHLVSEIEGQLRSGVDDGQLLGATFPPGSVTGAPKIAAMNVIAELESVARQVYTGAIGIVSPVAGLELSVAIRTFEITGSRIRLGVGGGVVADSDPQAEATELAVKAAPLLEALGASLPAYVPARHVTPAAHGPAHCAPRVRRLGPVPVPRPDPRRGVFETVAVQAGRALGAGCHHARLSASVAALYGTRLPDSLPGEIAVAAGRMQGAGRLRVDVTPGSAGELQVRFSAGPRRAPDPLRVQVWTLPGGLGGHKWADRRLIDAMEAEAPGQSPLLVDADGYVLETSRASVFALGDDGVLRTPPADGRILPGVARARVLSGAGELGVETAVAALGLDDLLGARGVVVTSALGCRAVLSIDGRRLKVDQALVAKLEATVRRSPDV